MKKAARNQLQVSVVALASSHNCVGSKAGGWGRKIPSGARTINFILLSAISAVDPHCRLWSWITLTMELNSAWSQEGRSREGEGVHTCISADKSLGRCLKERTLFKCELIFCYWIFVQARDGSSKPSSDSRSNKKIPFGFSKQNVPLKS